MALIEAAKKDIWLKQLVNDLGLHHEKAIVFGYSQSVVCLSKDQDFHDKMRHINVRYHFIRTEKRIEVKKISTTDNFVPVLIEGYLEDSVLGNNPSL